MKTQTKQQRKISSFSMGRWTKYAAAAAASTFAAASSAEATIHYSGLINQKIGNRDTEAFPLGDDGNLVLVQVPYKQGSSSVQFIGSAFCYASGAVSAGVNGGLFVTCLTSRDPASVSALKVRDNISTRPFFTGLGVLATNNVYQRCHPRGQFGDRGVHLLGFKFNNGEGVQYGWARLRMLGRPFNRMQLIDYAYADPGERIFAVQKSKDSAPAMESLGGLALGAAGLLAWRRRRSVRQETLPRRAAKNSS
jgi:hypothetical protein